MAVTPTVTVSVKIPAIKHTEGQRGAAEHYTTEVEVVPTAQGWVRVGNYEFSPQALLEAWAIINRYKEFE